LPGSHTHMQNISFNNNDGLGTSAAAGNNLVNCIIPNEAVAQVQRYRLVSSLVKVTYVGPMLDTSGRFQSCVTLDPFGINYASTNNVENDRKNVVRNPILTNHAQTLADRFCDFSLIRNGYWNRSVDIASSNSMEFLFIPMDKNSTVFERQWAYGGTDYSATDQMQYPQEQFTKMAHVVAVIGLPPNSKVLIEQFTNYEVLIDPSAVAFFGPNIDNPITNKDMDLVHQSITKDPSQLVKDKPTKSSTSFLDVMMRIGEIAGPLLSMLL
jgi:hypothetical protein